MSLAFSQIPNILFAPGVYAEYNNSRANQGLAPLPNRVLLIGSMLSSGSATSETLVRISREGDGGLYFGVDSQLGRVCEKFKNASKFTEVWAIGLDDADSAVAAEKTVTVTGTATSAGALNLLVHGERTPVGVASGDTPGDMALAIANKIAQGLTLLVTAACGIVITIGGTEADGDYQSIFTGFGLANPITVTTTRATTPATNADLATQHAADITTLISSTLAGVVVSATATDATVLVRVAGGLDTGTITHAQPDGATMANAANGIVYLTAKHGGAWTSDIDVRLNYYPREDVEMPAGVSVAIADSVSGTLDPDITDALDVIGNRHFTKIVSCYNGSANIAAVEAELEERWGAMVQQDGVAFYGVEGSFSDLTTLADSRNSQFTILCPPDGTSSPTPPWERAAVVAAVDSNEPDPARPRQTLPLPGVLPSAESDRFMLSERNQLLQAGIATFKATDDGKMLIERLFTTYTTDPASGLPDGSYRYVERMHILAAIRFTTRARFALKYPRHKLAADGTRFAPGQPVMTPSVARGELLSLFDEWELRAWVQGKDQFKSEMLVELDPDDPDRLNALIPPDTIKQFAVLAAQIQFS